MARAITKITVEVVSVEMDTPDGASKVGRFHVTPAEWFKLSKPLQNAQLGNQLRKLLLELLR